MNERLHFPWYELRAEHRPLSRGECLDVPCPGGFITVRENNVILVKALLQRGLTLPGT